MGMILPWLQSTTYRELQRRVDAIEEFLVAERLGEVANGPGIQRLGARTFVREGRDEDDRDRMVRCDQALLQLEPVHTRHMYVQDKAGCFLQPVGAKKFFGRGKGFNGEAK